LLYIVKEQFGTSTNVGHTNVGRQKPKTYKRWTVQLRRISTNVGPVQTSDQYKRRTGTHVRQFQRRAVPTTDQYTRHTKEDNLI